MILVYVEHDAGRLDRLSAEALTFARRLAGDRGVPLHAVTAGPGAADPGLVGALAELAVATLHAVEDPALEAYAPAALGACVAGVSGAMSPIAVVGPGSDRGVEVLAYLAARTGLALYANVTIAQPGATGGPWQLTRQRWGGSLLEDLEVSATTLLFTVAPHALEPEPAPVATTVAVVRVPIAIADGDLRARVVSHVAAEAGTVSLADARVVVGGGRGVGSEAGFAELDELAALLGGTVGVSRVVTSAGWRPHAQQVGQTGTRIAPDLYIACGISGAIQHIVGCRSAKNILAINTDRDAPLVARAQYAVIGDLHTVLPAIIAEVKAATGR